MTVRERDGTAFCLASLLPPPLPPLVTGRDRERERERAIVFLFLSLSRRPKRDFTPPSIEGMAQPKHPLCALTLNPIARRPFVSSKAPTCPEARRRAYFFSGRPLLPYPNSDKRKEGGRKEGALRVLMAIE